MRWLRHSRGFTLIELILVLAIAGLLLAGIVAGSSGLFQNSSFTSAMDNAQNQLRQMQNAANQAYSTNQISGGQSDAVVFGSLVQLSTTYPSPANIKSWTLIGAKDDTGNVVALSACDGQDNMFEDGVAYSPTTPGTATIVFTRNSGNSSNANATATGGQIFSLISPIGAVSNPGLPISGSLLTGAVPCPTTGSPLAPSQPPQVGVQDPCALLGQSDQRAAGSGNLSCNGVTPTAPSDIKAKDSVGAVADSLNIPPGSNAITTATPALVPVQVTLPSAQAGTVVTLYDNGTPQPTVFSCAGVICTASYTLSGYGAHVLTATWAYGGSFPSPPSAQITVTYSTPTTCGASTGYVCGLTGFYYHKGGSPFPVTTIIDKQVGCDLLGLGCNATGNGPKVASDPSSYNDFTKTLRLRAGFAPSPQGSTVDWKGQIYLAAGNQQVCIDSNSPAILTVGGGAPVTGTGGATPTCGTYSGGASGTWSTISIAYTDSVASQPYVRLVAPGGSVSQTEVCAYTDGIFLDTCDPSPTPSDIAICLVGHPDPPDLPQDASPVYYTCKVKTILVPGYQDIAGSLLRTTAVPPSNVKTLGLGGPSIPITGIALATAPALPYQQLVSTIQHQAQTISAPNSIAASSLASVFRAIARAIGPHDALAAVGSCDTNVLNPANYLSSCPAFTNNNASLAVPVTVTGDTTRAAYLNFDPNSNTITWSIR